MARLAVGLASGAGIDLPDGLSLWELAGGRPPAAPVPSDEPDRQLGEALEQALSPEERRQGAHYTPAPVAERVAALALDGHREPPRVVDPACGGGALLLAAGRRLDAEGVPPARVARDLLWGADIDPVAVAVTEAAIALWSGGTVPGPGHLVVRDTLADGPPAWPQAPVDGFDVVIGNPPFQGQLSRATTRSDQESARLRSRFGPAVTPYVDTAALFLLAATDLARPGGRVALLQPQSVVASRDARGVRKALAGRARLVDLWAPPGHLFDAKVHVCVPVLDKTVGGPDADGEDPADWVGRWATARGTPEVTFAEHGTLADLASTAAGFRDEYYGLVAHVAEAGPVCDAPLVTSGLIDVGACAWGRRPVRFAKQSWRRPAVDLTGLAAANPKVAAWVGRLRRPKVVVASQTRVVEAAADRMGTWVPSTPVVSVIPHRADDVDLVAALLCSPPVSAWAARRTAGNALSADAMRLSAPLLAAVPLPGDHEAWAEASLRLAANDLPAYAEVATAMFELPGGEASAALDWWRDRAKLTWPAGPEFR